MQLRSKILLAAFALACSSTPANFAGAYVVTIVDGANACNLTTGWTAGNSASNINVTMTQDGSTAELTVGGLTGLYLGLVLGTPTFEGAVSGDTFTATYLGTKQQTQQTCTYTTNAALSVTIDTNNTLSGTITYTETTNGDPTCGALSTCSNVQTISGARTGQ